MPKKEEAPTFLVVQEIPSREKEEEITHPSAALKLEASAWIGRC